MASSAKKSKRTDDEPEAVDSPSSSKKLICVICGGQGSASITKDQNYAAMLQLYWCTLGVDVKPVDCQKVDSCKKCFLKVVEYFETNDIIVYFENYFKSLRLNLLKMTLKGAAEWTKAGHTLTKAQSEVQNKYSEQLDINENEEERIRQTLEGYKMESYDIVDDSDDEAGNGNKKVGSRTGIKLTKASIPEAEEKNKKTFKSPQKKGKKAGDNSDSD